MEPDQATDSSEASSAPKQAGAPWRPEERKLLGTMPDVHLARRLGRSLEAVACKRRELKLPQAEG